MQETEKLPGQAKTQKELSLLTKCIGTILFTGYSPVAPGTAGALMALIPLIIFPEMTTLTLSIMILCGLVIGVWTSKKFETVYGDDPQVVVVDETVGMWVTMLFLPITWSYLAAGFLFFRIFDIIKPPPARQLESLRNGWGIMLDDVAAGIYAGLTVYLITIFI